MAQSDNMRSLDYTRYGEMAPGQCGVSREENNSVNSWSGQASDSMIIWLMRIIHWVQEIAMQYYIKSIPVITIMVTWVASLAYKMVFNTIQPENSMMNWKKDLIWEKESGDRELWTICTAMIWQ